MTTRPLGQMKEGMILQFCVYEHAQDVYVLDMEV